MATDKLISTDNVTNPNHPEMIVAMKSQVQYTAGLLCSLALRKSEINRSINKWIDSKDSDTSIKALREAVAGVSSWSVEIAQLSEALEDVIDTLTDQPEHRHPSTDDLVDAGLLDEASNDAQLFDLDDPDPLDESSSSSDARVDGV